MSKAAYRADFSPDCSAAVRRAYEGEGEGEGTVGELCLTLPHSAVTLSRSLLNIVLRNAEPGVKFSCLDLRDQVPLFEIEPLE